MNIQKHLPLSIALLLLCTSAAVASGSNHVASQSVLTWKQRQEVAMREAAFRYLVRDNARGLGQGVKHILVAENASPAVFRQLIHDGFAVISKETWTKTQVYYVTEAPAWHDRTHARMVVSVNFDNVAISTPTFGHGVYETFPIRLRRRGEHWHVLGRTSKHVIVHVA